jgi:hypothetical protein
VSRPLPGGGEEPPSVVAARQLAEEARRAGTRPGVRRPARGRRVLPTAALPAPPDGRARAPSARDHVAR